MEGAQINELQQNMQMRQALLNTGLRVSKDVGTFTESSSPEGNTTRVKLLNVGVITKLRLTVTANVTIATDALGASPKSPWNVIKQLKVVDYDGNDRINLSGYQLWVLNSVRKRRPDGINNNGLTAVSALPEVPTAIGTDDIIFTIDVPLAYDDNSDLRGAILAQTDKGELFLNVTWNDDFLVDASDDGVYNSDGTNGTCTVNSIAMQVTQDYIFPQLIGKVAPLPLLDLSTVYELIGNVRISDNLANGQEKLLDYPNARHVLGFYFNWLNGGAMANTISAFKLKVNSNNILREHSLHRQQMEQREWCNGDLKAGTFWFSHRHRPVQTSLYGNYQAGVTLSAAPSGTNYIEKMVESFHVKGAKLPGISQ